jgi:hypothetical protein
VFKSFFYRQTINAKMRRRHPLMLPLRTRTAYQFWIKNNKALINQAMQGIIEREKCYNKKKQN